MLPIIMLGSLILEVTYWHTARQRLALAMSQAVDLAAMQHGAESVAWLYLKHKRPELNIQAQDVQATPDTATIFSEFADPALSRQFGQPTIRHDFLMAQHEKYRSRGWSSGRGPLSGKTILEANTLSLTVTGWHRPYLSWLGAVMQLRQGYGRIAIRITQSALMQSHRFKPKGNSHFKKNRYVNNGSPNLITKATNYSTLASPSDQAAKWAQSAQSAQLGQAGQSVQSAQASNTNKSAMNHNDQQSNQPYVPKAWEGAEQTSQACGAGECCSDQPVSME